MNYKPAALCDREADACQCASCTAANKVTIEIRNGNVPSEIPAAVSRVVAMMASHRRGFERRRQLMAAGRR